MAETRIRLDKQIQKAPGNKYVPLSDGNGELQYAGIDAVVKATETLTRLNSVEVVNGHLVVKYTPEDGNQQVVSTPLNFSQTDINVADARLENPSTGVYRLIITESDGTTYPVDLTALLATVTQNTEQIILSGNGTPQSPLSATLSQVLLDSIPRNLDALDDVAVSIDIVNQEALKGSGVVLAWDSVTSQWVPKSAGTVGQANELTEVFRNLVSGDHVNLSYAISQIDTTSIKVYRNGLRLEHMMDYRYNNAGLPNGIVLAGGFTEGYPEKIIVDYRLKPGVPLS
ncbi:hypothetical protein CAP35_01235 [Chitinophagaceae bacterium IBVUCB1]|nr:hypothetical protein CAP35_01235 [Chitinophagaceae bacterium IBVUCB1]